MEDLTPTIRYRPTVQIPKKKAHKRKSSDQSSVSPIKVPKLSKTIVTDTKSENTCSVKFKHEDSSETDDLHKNKYDDALIMTNKNYSATTDIKEELSIPNFELELNTDNVIKVELVESTEENYGGFIEEPVPFHPGEINENSHVDPLDFCSCEIRGHDSPTREFPETEGKREWPSPVLNLVQLISVAIKNSFHNASHSTALQIVEFIKKNFPFYENKSWFDSSFVETSLKRVSFFQRWTDDEGARWTLLDTGVPTVSELPNALLNINTECMAYPENLEKMVSKTSIIWSSEGTRNEENNPHSDHTDHQHEETVEWRDWHMVTFTNLELCTLAVANTMNADGYTSHNEIYDFIIRNFPCFDGWNTPPVRSSIRTCMYKPYFKGTYEGSGPRRFTIVESELQALLPDLTIKIRNNRRCFRNPELIETFIHNLHTRNSGEPFQQPPAESSLKINK